MGTFCFPSQTIPNQDSRFLGKFWAILQQRMDTDLNHSIYFHPYTNGKSKFMSRNFAQFFRGYNYKHPNTWGGQVNYI